MKKLLIFPLAATVFLFGCQQNDSSTSSPDSTSEEVKIETVVNKIETDGSSKTVARLSINGMGCVMACGSAIKKSLNSLDGVIVTEINFEEDRETDFAIVEFDQSKVTSDEMVETVNTLRKGHYQVSKVEIDEYVPAQGEKTSAASTGEISNSANDKSVLEPTIETRSITFPNILDIFNRFVKQ